MHKYASMVGLLLMAWGFGLAQGLPNKPAPQGMATANTGGQGRVLYTSLSGSSSATKLAQAVRIGIQGYFDAAPAFQAAVRNAKDTQFQAGFTARLGGVPVIGLMVVAVTGPNQGQAALLFDSRQRAAATLPAMQRALLGGGGQARVQLTRTPFPDGSGYVGLAPGWQVVNSYKGTVDITGPGGTVMGLGGYLNVVPTSVAAFFPGSPHVSSLDPAAAFVELGAQGGLKVQILDRHPTPWDNGQAAFIRYRATVRGSTLDGFGLVALMPYDANAMIFYQSFVYAPAEVFPRVLPTALQTWASWSVNPAVFTERLMAAAQSMRGTSEIISGVNADRSRAYASINEGWSEYFRDLATAEDNNGNRSQVNQGFASQLVQNDPVNWRIVPASELIPR